jgi:hypothetical protein
MRAGTTIMNTDDARSKAEKFFQRGAADKTTVPDYEQRSRDIRQKIEYLRSLRMAAQAQQKAAGSS